VDVRGLAVDPAKKIHGKIKPSVGYKNLQYAVMHLSLRRVDAYPFGILYVSPELPHVIANKVATVHGTCRLLVARKVCAHHHFIFSIRGVNSSFVNVALVSPIFYEQ